jgi:predicted transcriptional regulator
MQKTRKEEIGPQLREVSELTGQLAEKIEKQTQEQDNERKKNFARILAENGYRENTLITDKEGFQKITTDKRMEILETLAEQEVDSVQSLADYLDRDRGNLSRDLDILFQEDMIGFEREDNRKKPLLKHNKIVPQPVEIN